MAIFLTIVLCLVTALAQATFSGVLTIGSVYPEVCLVLACVAGFLSGEYRGLIVGLTVGVFQDLLAPGTLGVNIILKGLAGVLAGATIHAISTLTGPVVLLITVALTWGCGVASLLVAYPVGDGWALFDVFLSFLLPQGLYNGLVTLGIFLTIQKFPRSMGMVESWHGRR